MRDVLQQQSSAALKARVLLLLFSICRFWLRAGGTFPCDLKHATSRRVCAAQGVLVKTRLLQGAHAQLAMLG